MVAARVRGWARVWVWTTQEPLRLLEACGRRQKAAWASFLCQPGVILFSLSLSSSLYLFCIKCVVAVAFVALFFITFILFCCLLPSRSVKVLATTWRRCCCCWCCSCIFTDQPQLLWQVQCTNDSFLSALAPWWWFNFSVLSRSCFCKTFNDTLNSFWLQPDSLMDSRWHWEQQNSIPIPKKKGTAR